MKELGTLIQRVLLIVIIVLFAVVAVLDVSGLAPGAGAQAIPFLVLLLAAFFVLRAVNPRRAAGAAAEEAIAIPQEGAARARLALTFGAGDLALTVGPPAGDLLAGTCAGAANQRVNRAGDEASITLGQPVSLARRRAHWTLALSPAVLWAEVRLKLGASEARLDLAALPVEELLVESGGTTVDATLPARGAVTLHMGGGRVTLGVPVDTAVHLMNEIRIGQVIIDEAAFPPAGEDAWGQPDAPLAVTLKGGLGTVEVVRLP